MLNKIKLDSIKQIIMPHPDKSQQKPLNLPLHSQSINFTPRSERAFFQCRYLRTHKKPNPESNQLHAKINKLLKKSVLQSKKNNSCAGSPRDCKKISFDQKLQTNDKAQQCIFQIPNTIKNISRVNQYSDLQARMSPHRRLFEQEEDFFRNLQKNTKHSTKKIIKDLLTCKKNFTYDYNASVLQNSPGIEIFECKNQQNHLGFTSYRSKTMHVEQEYQNKQAKTYLFNKKSPLNFSNKQKQACNETSNQANKFYEKFEKYCKLVQNEECKFRNKQFTQVDCITGKSNAQLTPSNQKYIKKRIDPNKTEATSKCKEKQNLIKKSFQNPQKSQLILIEANKSQPKIMIKSNSNNKGLKVTKTTQVKENNNLRETQNIRNQQEPYTKQTIKFINLTSYRKRNDQDTKKGNFSWRGERIHHNESENKELMKAQSKKSTKKSRYHFERNMKINNNIHVVVTQSNKTKINIFHNSILLKQDRQKIDALTSLVRDASKNAHGHKIEVPLELEINKLKIQGKSSGRDQKNFIQGRLQHIMKKSKEKKKVNVPRAKTQRKYQIKLQEVKPWQIVDQRQAQQSNQFLFNDKEYTYMSSKTIF